MNRSTVKRQCRSKCTNLSMKELRLGKIRAKRPDFVLTSFRGKDQKHHFEDMPGELQNVLRVQLRGPGDVSAVIETPGGFLLYVAKERTDAVLSVAGLSLPKRNYEQWLEACLSGLLTIRF